MKQVKSSGNKTLLVMLLTFTHLLVGYIAYMAHYFYPNIGGL